MKLIFFYYFFCLIGVAVGVIVLVALVISAYKIWTSDKFTLIWSKTSDDQNVATFLQSYGSLAPKRYTYTDIRKMTNSFKDKLGEGGFGVVYKGKLQDGRLVAVKNLKISKGDNGKDFINEVLSISRTNHVNIVTLLGFCFQGNKRALVFEFLSNGSLEKFIRGEESSSSLECETMFNIAVGIAKGLDYLHRGCNTHVYSYGMMLVDMVLGRKDVVFNAQCSETNFFPEWVYNRLEEEVATHGIKCDFKQGLERKMILVSLWCIQTYSSNRPPMNKVVEMLEGSLELLQMPPKPHLSSPQRCEFDTSLTMSTT
ncbi:LEAF RUST 10 DISEASE-RESISTANCE LOCUS RECEPTOR-LIKE PROTEIN KINASE-like 2.8 [Bienertia sinuspersici]